MENISESVTEITQENSSGIRISIGAELVSVVNYALYHNGFDIIKELTLTNESDRLAESVMIRVTSAPELCIPLEKHIDHIPAGKTVVLKNPGLKLNGDFLATITERIKGSIRIEVLYDDECVGSFEQELTALAFDEWHGAQYYPELLTSFITPNAPDVTALMSRASELLGQWTDDPSLDAYQSDDANRVMKMAAAAYEAIRERDIVYAVHPASFEEVGQRIRLCDAVMQQKMGNCMDLTLLYAAVLEGMGLHPLLLMKEGHIFAGVWLENKTFSETIQDDPSLVAKRLASGVNEIAVAECTCAASGKNMDFDSAFAAAEKQISEVYMIIDVTRSRLSGTKPLPVRIKTDDGIRLEMNEAENSGEVAAPKDITGGIVLTDVEETPATRKAAWERKLLDLGLRNSLINLRMSKTLIPVLTSSIDDLEDALADGADFNVLPRPDDWRLSFELSFETMHKTGEIENVLRSEFKNHRLRSPFTETELTKTVKELYRASKTSMEENGANTLYIALGLLKWYENPRSTKPRFAPLILLPIEMVRRSASQGYVIRLRDDEVQMNITILEKLRQDFGISINGLDPLPADEHGIDTRMVFTIIRKAIMSQKNWDVLESAYLGIFSFSQFVMWNDIRNRSDDLARNNIVKSLMDGKLCWEASDMTIGNHVSEDNVYLPLPADASQLFAIEAATKGESFVLHGPPGTGKSQTITALIANAMAQGKTVLFVAEKMAALEVVQRRLEKIGLGAFCLELHSNKARKKAVLEQLRRASEVTRDVSADEYRTRSDQISKLRKELDGYCIALHKIQNCGRDVYELINIYEQYREYPDMESFSDQLLSSMTSERMLAADEAVDELIAAARMIGHPSSHPLSRLGVKEYTQSLKSSLSEKARAYKAAAGKITELLPDMAQRCGMSADSFPDAFKIAESIRACFAWEGLPEGWSAARGIYMYLSNIREMCDLHLSADRRKKELMNSWNESFLELDGKALLQEYSEANGKWFLAKSMGVSSVIKKLTPHAKGAINKDNIEAALNELIRYQDEMTSCKNLVDIYAAELGDNYNGWLTDWEEIKKLADRAEAVADDIKEKSGSEDFRADFCTNAENIKAGRGFIELWDAYVAARVPLYSEAQIIPQEGSTWLESDILLCDDIIAHADELREYTMWNSAADKVLELGLEPVINAYRSGMEHDRIFGAYKKTLARGLAEKGIDSLNALSHFTGGAFDKKIARLRELDAEVMELTKKEIYSKLAARVPDFAKESAKNPELGIVQKAIRSGGRGLSIRKLFEQIPGILPRLCPCMLMSPISAAQYLDPNREPFDLVVFDEASQLQTCKAVGALARGKNAVVVGDPKQMPPTSFFAVNSTDEEDIEAEDLESILDDCLALNMPQTHLLWHYRSRHESLIAFSNNQFYENKLYTFPSVNDREQKVRLVHIDGVFERGKNRQNRAEAQAVIDELKRRCHSESEKALSVGVVTFNINQQNLIDDLLNDACKDDPELESWAYQSAEPVFIKNLENVQGDERDVILFSVGYGPDADGRVSMNFGPLNRDGGWRRLNVAVSRARCEMVVYSTLTADMINLSRTSAEGVAALRSFLEYASGKEITEMTSCIPGADRVNESVAEAICKELADRGYETRRMIGHSEYKIDIAVTDPFDDDRYILGILLDGGTYRSAKTTRDREIAQISVLEGLGWSIMRIWTMDWWDSPRKSMKQILARLETEKQKSAKRRNIDPETAAKQDKAAATEKPVGQNAQPVITAPAAEEIQTEESHEKISAAPSEVVSESITEQESVISDAADTENTQAEVSAEAGNSTADIVQPEEAAAAEVDGSAAETEIISSDDFESSVTATVIEDIAAASEETIISDEQDIAKQVAEDIYADSTGVTETAQAAVEETAAGPEEATPAEPSDEAAETVAETEVTEAAQAAAEETAARPEEATPVEQSDEAEETAADTVQSEEPEDEPEEQVKILNVYKPAEIEPVWLTDDEYLDEMNIMGLKKRINDILAAEAPVSEELLIRRLLAGFEIEEKTPAIESYTKKLFSSMNLMKSSDNGKVFYWNNSQIPGGYLNFRASGEGAAWRDVSDVPVEEAVNAVYIALFESSGMNEEGLIRRSAALMNYNITDTAAEVVFRSAVTYALRVRNAEKSEDGTIRLTESGNKKAARLAKKLGL